MWTITLVKFKRTPTKADMEALNKRLQEWASKGVKLHMAFYTLGRYDAVFIGEGPDEKKAMQFNMLGDLSLATTETMVAVSRDEVNSWMQQM